MICSKCGAKLEEGKLICENCGADIQLIPSFEPEIENEIQGSLPIPDLDDDEETGDEIYDEDSDPDAYYEEDAEEDYGEEWDEEQEFDEEYDYELLDELDDFEDDEGDVLRHIAMAVRQSRFRPLYIGIGALLIVAVIISGVYITGMIIHDNSSEYQAKMGMEAFDTGNYEAAIIYMDRAHTLDSSDSDITYKLAECYLAAGQDENALGMLWELGTTQAYQLILGYYIKNEDFDQAAKILAECNDENVVSQYQQYMANPPAFSEAEGSYEEKVTLKLSSNANGTIYYTMDGSTPDKNSEIYTTPLSLERGVYEIRAIFVNEYGMTSDEAYGKYTINLDVPDLPYVMPAGGIFLKPEMVTVKSIPGCSIYYTTDDSDPDLSSSEYKGPVPIPLGHSTMKFVAINKDGVAGEICEREYTLNIASVVDTNTIPVLLSQYNYNTEKTVDMQGHISKNTSQRITYSVTSAIAIKDGTYFIVTEYSVDKDDVSMKTGSYYLVDVMSSEIYKAEVDEDDNSLSLGDKLEPEKYLLVPGSIVP
ncbi:MAG: chitobiase/beta-hexosaminidase C-terminal domain-containing protein [Lachnospiraceae bacterium]|nr:chitobiase/beta-hexosaminidase C-terminal domain-containing protein [Lachnospiraceae bacterium]